MAILQAACWVENRARAPAHLGKMVIGTVKGYIHDNEGKNLVAMGGVGWVGG